MTIYEHVLKPGGCYFGLIEWWKGFFKSINLSTNTSKLTVCKLKSNAKSKTKNSKQKMIQPNNKKWHIQNPICILVPAGLMILPHFFLQISNHNHKGRQQSDEANSISFRTCKR